MRVTNVSNMANFKGGTVLFHSKKGRLGAKNSLPIAEYIKGRHCCTEQGKVFKVWHNSVDNYDVGSKELGFISCDPREALLLANGLQRLKGEHILDLRNPIPIIKLSGENKAYCAKNIGGGLIVKGDEVVNWSANA